MRGTRFGLLLVTALATGLAAAQAEKPQQVPTFGVTSELVYLRFHVENKGNPTPALEKAQLRVLEDGRPQTIALLETPQTRERTVPPEVTLALDVSSSVMDARLLDEALIKDVFIAGLSEETSVGLCAFGGELRCLTPPTREVRALLAGFDEAMAFAVESRREGTRLYLSLADICSEQKGRAKAQRALVVFSDGLDNRHGKVQEAIEAAQAADVRVYAIKVSQAFQATAPRLQVGVGFGGGPNRSMYDYKKFELDKLAAETGGRSYEPGKVNRKTMTEILQDIAAQVRTEYLIGYPPEPTGTPKKRHARVELVDKSLGSIKDGERTFLR
jgi:VWFA-related protein